MDLKYQRYTYYYGATLFFIFQGLRLGSRRTGSHETTKFLFKLNFLGFPGYGAPFSRLRSAGAPLKKDCSSEKIHCVRWPFCSGFY